MRKLSNNEMNAVSGSGGMVSNKVNPPVSDVVRPNPISSLLEFGRNIIGLIRNIFPIKYN